MILQSDAVWVLINDLFHDVPEFRITLIERDGVLNVLLPRSFDSLPLGTRLLATAKFADFMNGLHDLNVTTSVVVNYDYPEGVAIYD